MVEVNESNAMEMARKVKAGEHLKPASSLAEALARIYADGGRYVQKTGQMQGPMRYSYAKEGDFIATIRPLMELHGVTIRPKAMQLVASEVIETQTQNGTRRQNRSVVLVTFELLHTSGDRAEVQTFGEGIDSGDKSLNKAMTGAMKYAMRQTFCVETGDDPDDTPSVTQERAPARPEPAPVAPRDNMARRALHTMAYGSAKTRADFDAVNGAVRADAAAGALSAADIESLRGAAKQTHERLTAK